VSSPEDALAAARARAAERRAAGERPPDGFRVQPVDGPTATDLAEWAVVEPDLAGLRSTRRWGAPITGVKRGAYRLLGQYFRMLIAEQTRFNLQVALYVAELERRVRELEERQG
jgi:hypothetical protein